MDFSRTKPKDAPVQPQVTESALEFDITLVEDTHDRVTKPNAVNSLLVPLMGFTAMFAVVPMGGNRPQAWAVISLVVACLALVYFGSLIFARRIREPRFPFHWPVIGAGLVVPVFALFQVLPLGLGDIEGLASLSIDRSATMLAVMRCVAYLLAFIVTLEICARETRVRQLSKIIFYGVTVHALWAMISLRLLGDVALWGEKTSYLGWATGTFVNRNSFATFLGMGAIVGLAYVMDRGTRRHTRRPDKGHALSPQSVATAFDWICLFLIFSTLLSTGSRMGVFATSVSMACVAIVMQIKVARFRVEEALKQGERPRRHRFGKRARRAVPFVLLGIIGLLIVASGGGTADRAIFTEDSADTRLTLYQQVLGLIAQRPLAGFGLDNFGLAFPSVHHPDLSISLTWDLAHNTYLSNWSELGIIAGTAPIVAIGLAVVRLVAIVRARPRFVAGPVAALGVVMLVALHSLVDFSLEMAGNTLLFVIVVAMGLSQWRPAEAAEGAGNNRPASSKEA